MLLVVACCSVVSAGFLRAYLQAPKPLTSAEVLAATRRAVDQAVNAAIAQGGLSDAESFVVSGIASDLRRQGFLVDDVRLWRPNDLNPWAAFHFVVEAGKVAVRFELEGTRDPLLAIRLGLEVGIRPDPFHPYISHREPGILAVCTTHRFYHIAPEGPDFFARLENRTSDPYHFGFETFLTRGDRIAVDHAYLETGMWGLDASHRVRYGL